MKTWLGLGILVLLSLPAMAQDAGGLYTTQTITSGTMEDNRKLGFANCLRQAIVRVSGNQTLLEAPGFAEMLQDPGRLVASFSYRDRYSGKPLHDEQGSYDRPHDLTCVYDPKSFDAALAGLGGRPWPAERPTVAVMVAVVKGEAETLLSVDAPADPAMVESLSAAASGIALPITVPTAAQFGAFELTPSAVLSSAAEDLALFARGMNSDVALRGGLMLEPDGWLVIWRMSSEGRSYEWKADRINFDEAFRIGMRGAAQILSGNGQP